MTYSQLIDQIRQKTGYTERTIDSILDAQREIVIGEVANDGAVHLPKLGKFVQAKRSARKGRNPATGATIHIPEQKVMKFRPAKAVKEAINA
jgi:DNA-binding protein HU-beta